MSRKRVPKIIRVVSFSVPDETYLRLETMRTVHHANRSKFIVSLIEAQWDREKDDPVNRAVIPRVSAAITKAAYSLAGKDPLLAIHRAQEAKSE